MQIKSGNPILIAEIGNNHCGDVKLYKELILEAKHAGADLVKSQLFRAESIKGSMPKDFYKKCELEPLVHLEMMSYAESIGTRLFFSCFHNDYIGVFKSSPVRKFAKSQSESISDLDFSSLKNNPIHLVSFDGSRWPQLGYFIPMIATEYCVSDSVFDERKKILEMMVQYSTRPVGYSDHSLGIMNCLRALNLGVSVIEKHFCLEEQHKNISYGGKLFRDSLHSATPTQFSYIANEVHKIRRQNIVKQ